jgi:hypothetical protein
MIDKKGKEPGLKKWGQFNSLLVHAIGLINP